MAHTIVVDERSAYWTILKAVRAHQKLKQLGMEGQISVRSQVNRQTNHKPCIPEHFPVSLGITELPGAIALLASPSSPYAFVSFKFPLIKDLFQSMLCREISHTGMAHVLAPSRYRFSASGMKPKALWATRTTIARGLVLSRHEQMGRAKRVLWVCVFRLGCGFGLVALSPELDVYCYRRSRSYRCCHLFLNFKSYRRNQKCKRA